MNKTLTITIIIVVLIIVSGLYASYSSKDDMPSDEVMISKEEMMMKNEGESMMATSSDSGENMMKAGLYESYSSEKISMASSKDVVLFFRADWCPTCRAVDADIRANLGKIPENLVILDVDYDNSSVLKQKYKVTYQHTFVQVDENGNLIKKWMGSPTLSSLVQEVK